MVRPDVLLNAHYSRTALGEPFNAASLFADLRFFMILRKLPPFRQWREKIRLEDGFLSRLVLIFLWATVSTEVPRYNLLLRALSSAG